MKPRRLRRERNIGRGFLFRLYLPRKFTRQRCPRPMGKPSGRILFATPFVYTDPSVHVKFAKRYIDLGFDYLIFTPRGRIRSLFWKNSAGTCCLFCEQVDEPRTFSPSQREAFRHEFRSGAIKKSLPSLYKISRQTVAEFRHGDSPRHFCRFC